MRVLFVAMAHSIHTARWIDQVADQGWDIHLFPSQDSRTNPCLRKLTVHDYIVRPPGPEPSMRWSRTWPWPFPDSALRVDRLLKRLRCSKRLPPLVSDRPLRLARVIRGLNPDIVHSLEIQHAGYLTLDAANHLGDSFPIWIVTNWGSDIYLFGRLVEHVDRIKAVLAACDYYSCECQRDVQLAKDMGLQGKVLPVLPNTGGFDVARVSRLRQPGPTSSRRLILLKGYQGWAGRALVGLRAIALCADALRGYRVSIFLPRDDVRIAAELVSQSTGIPVDVIPRCSHDEMLRLFGRARAYVGLSISDAISTSLLEAMVMGAFPIQSCTACAEEWIEDGSTGLIVPPEDPEPIAAAIRRAVSDDALVDFAAEQNALLAGERLDRSVIQPQVIEMYERVAGRAAMKVRVRSKHESV